MRSPVSLITFVSLNLSHSKNLTTHMMRMFTKNFLSIAILFLSLSLAHTSQAQQITGTWDITPAPINGTYEPGQVIHVCFTLNYFLNGGGANWLHGVVINFPPGWDVSTITNVVTPTAPGAGVWLWMPNGITATNNNANGQTWGPGFYYDANSGGGTLNGNPGDNWGVSGSSHNHQFCFDITVGTNITDGGCGGPGNPLDGNDITPSVQITGDAESGSWNTSTFIPPATTSSPTSVTINCCDAESGIPPADDVWICHDGIQNLIDLLGAPIDGGGTWSGPSGWTDNSPGLGQFDPLNDPEGEYTYTVLGTDNCVSQSSINMVYNDMGVIANTTYCHPYTESITTFINSNPALGITVPAGGTWYNPVGTVVTQINPSTSLAGIYTYEYFEGTCPSSFQININVAGSGAT